MTKVSKNIDVQGWMTGGYKHPTKHTMTKCDRACKTTAFTRVFSCFSQPDPCDEHQCEQLQPPDECPVECATQRMNRAVWLHAAEMLMTVLFIVVGALAASGSLGNDKNALQPTDGYYVALEPQTWVWGLFVFFWIMLLAGTAVAIGTAYRSDAISYVLMPCYSVILALGLWVGAIFAWIYDSTHITAFALVLVAALLFHYAMYRMYATQCQVPPTKVYVFWIGSIAFAAGWSIYVATFLFDTVLTAQELSGFQPEQTYGSFWLALVFFVIFAAGWSFTFYSFIYAGAVAIGIGASLGGNLDRGKGVGNDLSIVLIIALVLLGKIWILSFYKRFISKAYHDGGMIFVGHRRPKDSKSV
ncbi:MAG: hypothetical protein CMP20_15785 [Rickettsiales bacterium]|nr:hypothetical protein [Rickettsiales bacterium]